MPDKELIKEISLETGIDTAFIEKDWFAVQLIALLTEYQNDKGVHIVFSGGTSLSKGYNLIKRFSEDLDFVLEETDGQLLSQGQRRSFRRNLIEHVIQDNRFLINDSEVMRGDSSRFFKVPIKYKRLFEHAALRPHLQLEMTFSKPRMLAETCEIQSIISKVMGNKAETNILCVSPLETAGDKLSALTWRVVIRDRGADNDDPALIRHLHDLAALEQRINEDSVSFIATARQSLEQDQSRRGGDVIKDMSIQDRFDKALYLLKSNDLYRKEYDKFVMNMSYADESEKIDFDSAYRALENIIRICCSK